MLQVNDVVRYKNSYIRQSGLMALVRSIGRRRGKTKRQKQRLMIVRHVKPNLHGNAPLVYLEEHGSWISSEWLSFVRRPK